MLVTACKTSKDYYNRKGELKNITDLKLQRYVENNYLDFHTLFIKKFKAQVEFDGESKSFKGNLYITKDSSIIVSIYPLMGIELLRTRFTPSGIEILDRTKRDYIVGDYDFLWDRLMLDVDFNIVQNILLNQLFVYPVESDASEALRKYKHDANQDYYTYSSIKEGRSLRLERRNVRKDLILHEFYILPEIFKVKRSFIKDFDSNGVIEITYDDFFESPKGLFPSALSIKGRRGTKSFEINLSFNDMDLDGEHSLGFRISEKYSKKSMND